MWADLFQLSFGYFAYTRMYNERCDQIRARTGDSSASLWSKSDNAACLSSTHKEWYSQVAMPSAAGFIKGIAGGNVFTSTFIIDDIQYHFSGRFNPAVQEFVSNSATLEYESLESLTRQRDFSGKVGTQSIDLHVADGLKITGNLELPMSPATRVSGTGTWNQN
ncbi:hypothetical protein CSIM01_08071 [Colletotrichum simmondsii]|uniref:Uncharacterized protein n=1 Tax=Colletotrichum simmondsii TaxID=703756 RepID=A0A135T814_9PEZI|nr:hypothetical protein CSIM01_08071 [Colletotrichum simmondsii]